MVNFAQLIGAAALLSHSVLAAPAVRRDNHQQYDDGSYKEAANYGKDSYGKDSYDKGSDWKPSYDDQYKNKDEHKKEPPSYGSGQEKWGQSYEDCVTKCVAQHGEPPKEWKPAEAIPPPPAATGAIHTVMVAPMQGVLRYWPFAVNASVGDTIRYIWSTPANHTATLSSSLLPCNRSVRAEELNWASGVRNSSDGKPNVFDVEIKTDEQQFFYCSVGKHCESGMFGMVQPKQGGNNTVSFHMQSWLDSNPDLKAAWANVHEQTKDTPADTWGNNMSVEDIPESSYMALAQNIIWNRAMFAANPGSQEASSATTSDGSPIKIVGDLNTFLASTSQDPVTQDAPANAAEGSSTPVPAASDAPQVGSSTSAGLKTSAPVWVAAFVGAVSYLVL